MSINSYIARQFADPNGLGGSVISLVMNRQNRPLYDETIRLLEPSDSGSVLDIGSGNGYVLNLLARQYNATFTGIDTSENIIGVATRRNRGYIKSEKMSFSCQDVSSMSFAYEVFSISRDTNIASQNVAKRNRMSVCETFVKHYYGVDRTHYIFSTKRGFSYD